ncbi:hypothetical protein [Balneola vulgaris]|uniref:hypothetical protein n=1 Tax=Balneola vulgaris TaxID=287535 RepID=UPI000366BCDB|nr:hypothetical protein [Balneola vulgaris]
MSRYNWADLNKQQVGTYSEYFVKMELTMYGFQVYTTEVDDRGIDFIARYEHNPFIEVQVKSVRKPGYVFLEKTKFEIKESLFLALVLLTQGKTPKLYLIPSNVWKSPNSLFKNRDYKGKKSKPEWGLNLSLKNMVYLEEYLFENTVFTLKTRTSM